MFLFLLFGMKKRPMSVYKNNSYFNKFVGKNCTGEEKVIRIKKQLKHIHIAIDYETSCAYSDLPMMSSKK